MLDLSKLENFVFMTFSAVCLCACQDTNSDCEGEKIIIYNIFTSPVHIVSIHIQAKKKLYLKSNVR